MIRMKTVMTIARAERLINRRLVRYWFFLSLAYIAAFLFYTEISYYHGFFSSYSGTVGVLSPRFILSLIGLICLIIFLAGGIFLAFDVRARDTRERIIEVLDSRPYTNLELVTGRFLGIFLSSWIPIVVLVILFDLTGFILQGLGVPLGEPIEIFSIFSFILIMAIPALSFTIALVFFVTLLMRSRIAAAVTLLVLMGLCYWATFGLPLVYGALFDITGFVATFFCSEIDPHFAEPESLIQRFSVLLAAFSLLGFSAVVHPRLDGGSRLKLTTYSIIVMLCALSLTGIAFYQNTGDIRLMETWQNAHAALVDETVPDLKKITGKIKIDPGKDLFLSLDITFGAPDEEPLKKALFTLNPGQEVKSIVGSSGKPLIFTHENGLLEFNLPQILEPGEEITVHLTVQGLPDDRFAFMESAFNPLMLSSLKSGKISLFGLAPGLFDKSFVALMPGLRWLPISGTDIGRDDPRIRAVDYFYVDLQVNLPGDWLVAGPGRRHTMEGNSDGESFRFSPLSPVPEVAMIASRFESRALEVEGVTLEVLINKKHMKNIELMAETSEMIQEWVGDRLKEAKEYGLGYPYDALTLVEVPNYIRTYGGGWRMDTVMAPPGMLLMREMGFPTARFDVAFRKPEEFKDREGGIQQAKFERLKTFFMNDFTGGNILTGGVRNFFMYQTSAEGPEGLALNYVMETLTTLLIMEKKSYFSIHTFLKGENLDNFVAAVASFYGIEPLRATSLIEEVIESVVSRPEVWEQVLGDSLKDIDLWEDPALTVDVLTLKTNAIAQSILDTLGPEKARQLLASIRGTHKGESFSINDVLEAGKALGYDLTEIMSDWLNSTNLPGFICDEVKIYRIPNSEDGTTRYQMLFTVRNDEPVPGLFCFLFFYTKEGGRFDIIKSEPIRMTGKSIIRYGDIVSTLPANVFVEPYFSLNRNSFKLTFNNLNQDKIEEKDAIEGVEELPYFIPQETSIVIDDLDPGFSVIEENKNNGLRLISGEDKNRSIDQGLPLISQYAAPPGTWSRLAYTTSFGKYRHTVAVIGVGKGEKKAMFKADINKTGEWDLELHLPFKAAIMPGSKWGKYHLVITDINGDMHEIIFDSKTTSMGWNLAVGSVYLPEGETTVTLSNKTDGQFVLADAIRWSPSAGK